MRDREHPTPDLLFGFLQGETSKTESRAIVRHLLSGCRSCVAVTRPLWQVTDGRGRGKRGLRLVREGRA